MFEEQSFFRTDVVHASGTGSRGPWVGRGSRLAGPRPGTGDLAGPGPRARRSPGPEESGGFPGLTPDEVAEIEDAAADQLLAVEAASTGRRGPGQPGSARVFPGESASPAAAFGPGMPLDVLPGCAQLPARQVRRPRPGRDDLQPGPRPRWEHRPPARRPHRPLRPGRLSRPSLRTPASPRGPGGRPAVRPGRRAPG